MSYSQFGERFQVWQTTGAEMGKPVVSLSNDGSLWYEPCGKAVLYRRGNKLFAIFKATGGDISLTASWHGWGLNFDIWVPQEFRGMPRGILGDFDRNRCNDYIDRCGVRLPDICDPHPQETRIYNHMLSCKSRWSMLNALWIISGLWSG